MIKSKLFVIFNVLSIILIGCGGNKEDSSSYSNQTEKDGIVETKDYHFRKSRWGDSAKMVKSIEEAKLTRKGGLIGRRTALGYSGRVIDENVKIIYIFIDDKLVRAKYVTNVRIFKYLDTYHKMKKSLIVKYGEQFDTLSRWRDPDDLKQYGNPEGYVKDIAEGYFRTLCTQWKTEETVITLYSDNEIGDWTPPQIEYSSVALKELEEEVDREKALEELQEKVMDEL